jgi:hypothetical protein
MGDPNTNKLFHRVIVWVLDIGDWNLKLDYWSNHRTSTAYRSTKTEPISTEAEAQALYDIALYDESYYDDYSPNVIPIIFNLDPGVANSNQGTAIQLQFRNDNANEPITVHGFSVQWSVMGGVQ